MSKFAYEQILARDVQLPTVGKLPTVSKCFFTHLVGIKHTLCFGCSLLIHEQFCAELARCGYIFVAHCHYDVIDCASVKIDRTAP